MTIIVATREFIAADSRLSSGDASDVPLTIGKVFRRKGGGLFASAGDSRRTSHFDRAIKAGREPTELDVLEAEDFEAVLLMPDKTLIYYDTKFAPFPFGEERLALGAAAQVARSWLLHEADPVTAIKRCIEVDRGCGYPITVAYREGGGEVIYEDGTVEKIAKGRTR